MYEFYAGYKEAVNDITTDIETFSIGEKQAVVADNGYYKNISLDSDDPHLERNLAATINADMLI